jgi:phosphoribosylaminoimidazole-succinocarboxamide synthase
MASYHFQKQTSFYQGKVRDVYVINDELVVMIASDRISAFDVILPKAIPYKGQVLNQVAAYMLNATKDICTNWLMDTPAPNASLGRLCQPYKVEMVVRGYLSGHAWRTYSSGSRILCGVTLPEGLKENDRLPCPMITPSTKASAGHDEDISREEIISDGLVPAEEYEQIEQYCLKLFARGQELANKRGLILVDTKYEFGKLGDEICLMDEIHTPDSSRYFFAEGYEERQKSGLKQQQLSKEFVREWLIANNFMGKKGQVVPEMNDEWVTTISNKYIELYEKLIGEPFKPESLSEQQTFERINESLQRITV